MCGPLRAHRFPSSTTVLRGGIVVEEPRHVKTMRRHTWARRQRAGAEKVLRAELREITDKRIRQGSFRSVKELVQAILDYIAAHNANPQSFHPASSGGIHLERQG